MKTNTFLRGSRFLEARMSRSAMALALACALAFAASPRSASAFQDAPAGPQDQAQAPTDQTQGTAAPAYTAQTPAQLQQLVAPIALYPDSLVAQVLAASTFPAEIVEADRWVQNNSTLKGDALAQA